MTDLGHDPGALSGVLPEAMAHAIDGAMEGALDGGMEGGWAAKLAGAIAGASVSLIYLLPKSRREAASRFVTGLSCGLIFGGPTGLWLAERLSIAAELSGPEMMLTGSAAASLCAWWVLGVLARVAQRYGRKGG